jgi:methylmalonyl-CoA/ethylmalonyl-CoA epimerase
MSPPPKLRVLGLDHVAVCVSDLGAAAQLFAKILGREPSPRERVPDQTAEAVFFDLADGVSLELFTPRKGERGLERFLEKRGPGLHHLALKVEGLAEGLAALKAEGLPLVDETARAGTRGHQAAFLHPKAAGGVLVELVERRKKRAGGPG